MLPSLLILDDFISDPLVARNAALALNYDPQNKHGNYPGHISTTPLDIQGLNERISGIINAGYSDINALIEDVVNKDTNHPAKWEKVMTVPMRFNRLILFSPWMFHNSGMAFGKTPQDGRLVNLMFFAKG